MSDAPDPQHDELLRALQQRLPSVAAPAPPPLPELPFTPLPALDVATQRRLRAAALQANDRYVLGFLEQHSVCPFARGGRLQGQVARFVHFVESDDPAPFVELMRRAADDPTKAVVQVILPLVSVEPSDWYRFCHQITAAANARLRDGETFAVAPLHPALPYKTENRSALIPLFRRTPDPTVQWVRLDAIEALYQGRSGEDVYVAPTDILKFLAVPRKTPLFDRIAETNLKMARRLGFDQVERTLREIHLQAQSSYQRILLGEAEVDVGPSQGCPRHAEAEAGPPPPSPSPPIAEREGAYALAPVRELPLGTVASFRVEGVDLVVVRTSEAVHVLHGRCPHRMGSLATAIIEDEHIVCAHHGWDFRLSDGCSDGVPGEVLHRFATRIDGGLVWVEATELRRVQAELRGVWHDDDLVL
ncbi:MAG: Rieske 2Fe-2S domain-containing protein [Polyangiaceae bacterium]|jgi:nitrite reductase/ring-hydroxylating ferredoxin subunit|nr:Rieske 2Fe-2S domain-containing protein [Polyangiaceae bacterium]MBK8936532.1 Rieske 2Fe-2S domain-containing protein [Polyangiaceae bacterium]